MVMSRLILVTLCYGALSFTLMHACSDMIPSTPPSPHELYPIEAPHSVVFSPGLAPLASPPEFFWPSLPPVSLPPPEGPVEQNIQEFDVTDYGAVADGQEDNSEAFMAAWEDACNNQASEIKSRLLIPEGTYRLGPVSFDGPCHENQSPEVVIRGTLKAPKGLHGFKDSAWIWFKDLQGLTIRGIPGTTLLDGQGKEAWRLKKQLHMDSLPRTLKFDNISDGSLRDLTILNSKGFHITILKSENFTVQGLNISAPSKSPNTDGIHVGTSTNIHIASSIIGTGDDCVSIGPNSYQIYVRNITCGPGHGISVGSLGRHKDEKGVGEIHVKNCTIIDTQNGVRIKTWPESKPSEASNITFEDIHMINVSRPIIIDQNYCNGHHCHPDLKPSLVQIKNVLFKRIWGTSKKTPVVTKNCSSAVPCKNVTFHAIDLELIQEYKS